MVSSKNDVGVVVIGGGLSGASTAYHLKNAGLENILVLEAGRVAHGNDEFFAGTGHSLGKPAHSKMVLTSFDSDVDTVVDYLGRENASTYAHLKGEGRELQKKLAEQLDPNLVRTLGTLHVGKTSQWKNLREEHRKYRKLGIGHDFEHWNNHAISHALGCHPSAFDGGVFYPNDAIVNAEGYVNALLNNVGRDKVYEQTKVVKVEDTPEGVVVHTNNRGSITADKVVVATNGFMINEKLEGLLTPTWTYLISFDDPNNPHASLDYKDDSPNAYNFTEYYRYWTRQDGTLLFGGGDTDVDGESKRTPVDKDDHIEALIQDAWRWFPHLKGRKPMAEHYGVMCYTEDEMPIVGKLEGDHNVYHIVGCNGDGQSSLSYSASLLPGIMGYTQLQPQQKPFAELVSPKRESLQ